MFIKSNEICLSNVMNLVDLIQQIMFIKFKNYVYQNYQIMFIKFCYVQ